MCKKLAVLWCQFTGSKRGAYFITFSASNILAAKAVSVSVYLKLEELKTALSCFGSVDSSASFLTSRLRL